MIIYATRADGTEYEFSYEKGDLPECLRLNSILRRAKFRHTNTQQIVSGDER